MRRNELAQPASEITVPVALPAYCLDADGSGFYAVTADMTLAGLRFRAARIPSRGEALECRLRNVDPFHARVVRISNADFVVKVGGNAGSVLRQIMDAAGRPDATTVRVAPRFVPDVKSTLVTLQDGTTFLAEIANLSATGVAIRTQARIAIGSTLNVGRTRASVVRVFEGGFGATFARPFMPSSVDRALVL